MSGVLEGDTYPGTALVADVRVSCDLPRDGSALVASLNGSVLLAPLPPERWLTFIGDLDDDKAERLEHDTSVDAITASLDRRITAAICLTDVAWVAPFRMHRRIVQHLAARHRFLLGHAAYLSSPSAAKA